MRTPLLFPRTSTLWGNSRSNQDPIGIGSFATPLGIIFPEGYLDTGKGAVPSRDEFNSLGDARAPDEDPSPLSPDLYALGEIEEHKDPIGIGSYATPLGIIFPEGYLDTGKGAVPSRVEI